MPKIFGLNSLAVIAASVVFFFIGFLWYGVVFSDAWMAAVGVPEGGGDESPIYMLGGFIITVIQVIGLGIVLKWKGAADMNGAIMAAVVLWLVFVVPIAGYGLLYTPAHSLTLFMIDAGHLLVGWVVSAIILSMMK